MGHRKGLRFSSLSARAFCQATESVEKVRAALRTFIPDDTGLSLRSASGHFGNPITIIEGRIESARAIREVLSRVPVEVPAVPTSRGSAFVLRFDKASALTGALVSGTDDPILVRIAVNMWGCSLEWDEVISEVRKKGTGSHSSPEVDSSE
jgi:RNA binding exosome subunit